MCRYYRTIHIPIAFYCFYLSYKNVRWNFIKTYIYILQFILLIKMFVQANENTYKIL